MGVEWGGQRPRQAPRMADRFWLTARAARALGHAVPERIQDGEAVRLIDPERETT